MYQILLTCLAIFAFVIRMTLAAVNLVVRMVRTHSTRYLSLTHRLYNAEEIAETVKIVFLLFLPNEMGKIQQYFLIVFNETIIPLTLVGY